MHQIEATDARVKHVAAGRLCEHPQIVHHERLQDLASEAQVTSANSSAGSSSPTAMRGRCSSLAPQSPM